MKTNTEYDKTQQLVITALMTSLIFTATISFRIPIPLTQGYVHLGDAMIYLSVMILGKKNAAAASGIGSAMGDIFSGFSMWAPWSLIIKGTMAFITGMIIEKCGSRRGILIPAMTAGGLLMCAGYLTAERILYGNWAAALPGVPWNTGQFAAGILFSLVISRGLNLFK